MLKPLSKAVGSSFRRLRLAVIIIVALVMISTVGLMVIEGWSFMDSIYMTIITLATVGFQEVHPLGTGGRILIMFVTVFGVMAFLFMVAVMAEMAFQGHFTGLLLRHRMGKQISELKGHSIIAGFGRVGRQVALEFTRHNVPFVIIERREEMSVDLAKMGYLNIIGDATDEATLQKVRIETAKTLVSTLPEESQNVYLTLTARYLNPDVTIIARADYEDGARKLQIAGASHVVVPHVLGGTRMAMAALQPNVLDFMRMAGGKGGLVIEEVQIPELAYLVGRQLKNSELKERYGASVIGIKKPEQDLVVSPPIDAVIDSGDILVLIGDGDQLERLSSELRGQS